MGISSTLRSQLASCAAPVETAATLPAACYVDAAVFEAEQTAVFRTGWVGVGRSDRWKNSGDYSAMEIGGVPIVVVRDEHGTLRCYANTCMHRSAQIMTGEGNCARMRCPFHAWTYALDGRLVGAPSMNKTPNFDQADHGLVEFAATEHEGFSLISFDADPVPLTEWFADFSELHSPWNLADLVTVRRREFVVNCNWKGFAEVFNEYYHLPYVHKASIGDRYTEPDACEPVAGAFATQFGLTNGPPALLDDRGDSLLPAMPELSDREANGVRYTWMFPNIVVALGAEVMWMYEVYPDGPGRVKCAQVIAAPQATIESRDFEDRIDAYYERFDVAIGEDIPVLEQQYVGQKSPFAKQSRYSYLEPSVALFARWYAERLLTSDH